MSRESKPSFTRCAYFAMAKNDASDKRTRRGKHESDSITRRIHSLFKGSVVSERPLKSQSR